MMAFLELDIQARWPGGCVPYDFDRNTIAKDEAAKAQILDAMKWWSDACDLRFIKRTVQNHYIRFIPDEFPMDGVCRSSTIGMGWQPTDIRIDPSASTGTLVHEIGHALGFVHEHQRPDRDSFVNVDFTKINPIYLFNFLIENNEMPVDGYDLDSIMHYGAAQSMSMDGKTDIVTTIDPGNAGRIPNRDNLSAGDIAAGNMLNKGDVHVIQYSAGQLEKQVQQANWTAGWTSLSPFTLDARSFIFRYKAGDGTANINQINSDGTIPRRVQSINLGAGWTSALVYTVGLRKCLLLYNSSSGDIELRGINGITGHVDSSPFASADWGSGWTSVNYYQAGLIGDYMLFYNQSNGDCRVDNINFDGGLGQQKQFINLTAGWDVVNVYKVDGKNYLFRLKSSNGSMVIRRIGDNGQVGKILQEQNWSSGWTMALSYQSGGNSYLFLLKQSDGTVHINRIKADGQIGAISDVRQFSPGWRIGATYGVGTSTYLVIVKA